MDDDDLGGDNNADDADDDDDEDVDDDNDPSDIVTELAQPVALSCVDAMLMLVLQRWKMCWMVHQTSFDCRSGLSEEDVAMMITMGSKQVCSTHQCQVMG